MINQKQIDNLSKYCYDISKLVMGLAVVGIFVSGKFSMHTSLIGLVGAVMFLISGHFLDRLEVSQNDKH